MPFYKQVPAAELNSYIGHEAKDRGTIICFGFERGWGYFVRYRSKVHGLYDAFMSPTQIHYVEIEE